MKWIILCHIVEYLLLTVCAKFDGILSATFKVMVKKLLAYLLWIRSILHYTVLSAWQLVLMSDYVVIKVWYTRV